MLSAISYTKDNKSILSQFKGTLFFGFCSLVVIISPEPTLVASFECLGSDLNSIDVVVSHIESLEPLDSGYKGSLGCRFSLA